MHLWHSLSNVLGLEGPPGLKKISCNSMWSCNFKQILIKLLKYLGLSILAWTFWSVIVMNEVRSVADCGEIFSRPQMNWLLIQWLPVCETLYVMCSLKRSVFVLCPGHSRDNLKVDTDGSFFIIEPCIMKAMCSFFFTIAWYNNMQLHHALSQCVKQREEKKL